MDPEQRPKRRDDPIDYVTSTFEALAVQLLPLVLTSDETA